MTKRKQSHPPGLSPEQKAARGFATRVMRVFAREGYSIHPGVDGKRVFKKHGLYKFQGSATFAKNWLIKKGEAVESDFNE